MKLSTRGRYAVMAMVDLSTRSESQPVTLSDIASRQEISLSYLEQLFAKLRKGGLVTANRGPGGGYQLAHPANAIRIFDVISAVDEPISTTRCKTGSSIGCIARDGSRCLTHDLWDELSRQIYLYLSSVTLEDVTEKRVSGGAGLFDPDVKLEPFPVSLSSVSTD